MVVTDKSNVVLDFNIPCKLDSGDSTFALKILLWQPDNCKMLQLSVVWFCDFIVLMFRS